MQRGTNKRRLGTLSIGIGLIGSLAGCGGGGGDDGSARNANNLQEQPKLTLDVFGARGDTLTASSEGCVGGAKISWAAADNAQLAASGASVADPAPEHPLQVTASCGNASATLTLAAQNVFASPGAFAVIQGDGTLAVWGDKLLGGDLSQLKAEQQPKNVVQVVGNERALAALQADGKVVSWGSVWAKSPFVSAQGATSNRFMAAAGAFGKVVKLWPTLRSFVALNEDGSVATWGVTQKTFGGLGGWKTAAQSFPSADALSQLRDIRDVSYNLAAVAALKKDGTVVAWGDPESGGDTTPVAAKLKDVVKLYATDYQFAALKKDGSVVSWGTNWETEDFFNGQEAAPQNALNLIGNGSVLAVLGKDGAVSTIGSGQFDKGANLTLLEASLSNVAQVFASKAAFAALKKDGSVVTWGDKQRNDPSAAQAQLNNVVNIASTELAFAALKKDGSVVSWGDETRGGDSSAVQAQLNNVVALYANDYAFAALKKDGSVVTWGAPMHGGDSRAVQDKLKNIRAIYHTSLGGFLAVAKDGRFVSWGGPSAGDAAPPASLKTIPYLKS
ncbi:RCC1 domain-containing protein [Chromobacterium alticapitis]|uniref:Chromosome condensation regulator RCC1 n=1 Tax=Chromobacterium alticapitis TaxID=2073169 RepID=A0A2S5DCY7_9NEIS|nr:hypothetical protein [Chromobacterium alticapitis]POZ60852.1 hypothetical protein C2I19_16650 [Chromobacterium alticapitis]